ncbi:MAG: protein kinase [Verrucomicrobia bacterium]|nr:protein kinase [Verrucomicrobiota bacterium]
MQTVFENLGPYELLGELGSGGMGVVYLARDPRMGRLVALKVIRPGLEDPTECKRRLRVEAEAAGALDHPGIVPILDIGETGATPYLAMKYLPGGTLAEHWASGPFNLFEAPRLLAAVAAAVEHAHQRGVLHRDLKPSNILLDEEGNPHLTDFGLAKLLGSDLRLTLAQSPLGTCGYMAPEVARNGAQDATMASDIYSLGAILYEWIAGRPPYVAKSYPEFLEKIRTTEPPAPRRVRQANRPGPQSPQEAAWERDLELICLRCLEREPQRRYASARSVAQDLEALMAGRPLSVRPQRPDERIAAWVRQNRVLALSGAAVWLSLCLGLALTTWQWISAEKARRILQETNVRLALERFELESTRAQRKEALRDLVRLHQENPDSDLIRMRLWSALVTRHHLMRQLPPLNHAGPIGKVVFSPDGRWLVVGAGGQTPSVTVWDTQSAVSVFSVPVASSKGWQLDAAGRCLLVISSEGRAECRALPQGERIPGPWDSLGKAEVAALSPSGQAVATLHGRDLQVRDRRGGSLSWSVRLPAAGSLLTFSHDGQELLAVGVNGIAWRCSADWGRLLESLEPAIGQIESVQSSPRGEGYLLVGEKVASIGPPAPGSPERLRLGYTLPMESAVFSPDGSKVILTTRERIHILQVPGGRTDRFSPGAGFMNLVQAKLSPDGTTLAFAMENGEIRLHNQSEPFLVSGVPEDLSFSSDARRLAVGTSEGVVHVLTTRNQLLTTQTDSRTNQVAGVGSPDGQGIVLVGEDRSVRWFHLEDGLTSIPLGELPWLPDSLEYDGSGRWLVARRGGALALRNGRSALGSWMLLKTNGTVGPNQLSWDATGNHLLLTGRGRMELWDLTEGKLRSALAWEVPTATQGYLSPSGRRIAEVTPNGIWIRTVDGGEPVLLPELPAGPHREVVFSPDGRWLTVADREGVRVWRLGELDRPPLRLNHGAELSRVAFSPDSRELLTGGLDRQLKRWRLSDGVLQGRPLRFGRPLETVLFSPDGHHLATVAGRDLELWDYPTLSPIEERRHYSGVPDIRFSDDGRRIILRIEAGPRARLEVLDLPSRQLPPPARMLAWAQLALDEADWAETGSTAKREEMRREIGPGGEVRQKLRAWRVPLGKPGGDGR